MYFLCVLPAFKWPHVLNYIFIFLFYDFMVFLYLLCEELCGFYSWKLCIFH